jgi:Overcoming lysogenization defect protein-like, TOPRIM domain
VGRFEGRHGSLTVESEVSVLLGAGHSRTDATRLMIERRMTEARHATTVVLVEGWSDQIALEVLAERQGRALRADGTFVVPTGGATNFARFLAIFGPGGRDVRLAGLYDSPVEDRIRRSLETAGVAQDGGNAGLESFRFYRCVTDLEHEMIRALGSPQVEHVVAAEGELRSFRRLQRMPFHRQRPLNEQLHRFIGTHSGRKYQYARSLALSLDLTNLPKPLAGLLEHL